MLCYYFPTNTYANMYTFLIQVIVMVFQYLKLLQSQPPSEKYYDELAHIAQSTFSYKEMVIPIVIYRLSSYLILTYLYSYLLILNSRVL